jgi:hypothetical protein
MKGCCVTVLVLIALTLSPIRSAGETEGPLQSETPHIQNTFQSSDPADWILTSGDPPTVFVHWTSTMGTSPSVYGEPPDPHGSVGPKGVLSTDNQTLIYWRRNNVAVWNEYSFFAQGGALGKVVDPRALYDPLSERFFVFGSEFQPSSGHQRGYLNIAVSKTSDPATKDTLSWRFFRVDVTEVPSAGDTLLMDLPCVGFDDVAIYVAYNMFHVPPGAIPLNGASYRHCRVHIFDKSQLLSGTVSLHAANAPDGISNGFTLQPITLVGSPSAPGQVFLAEIPWTSSTTVRLWSVTDPFGSPSLQSATVSVPNNGGFVSGAPQAGTLRTIDTQSPRTQGDAFMRGSRIWFCNTAGGPFGPSKIFYYCLDPNGFPSGTPLLVEAGSIDGGTGVWNYQPAIGGNRDGDVAIVFTQSSSSTYPTMMATLRREGASAFATPAVVKPSPTSYIGNRWGDYARVAVDPVDQTMWVTHEWAQAVVADSNWATEWGQILPPDSSSGWPVSGRIVRGGVTEVGSTVAISDGSDGGIIAWADGRLSSPSIYVERLENGGAISAGWKQGGSLPMDIAGAAHVSDGIPLLATDFSQGAFVGFNATGLRIQRLTSTGTVSSGWPAAGVALSNFNGLGLTIDSGPASGAVAAWRNSGIRAQRVSFSGALDWGTNGVQLATTGSGPIVAADGKDGAIVAWAGLKLQRVSAAGSISWTSGGISPDSGTPLDIVSDGQGGAYVAYSKTSGGAIDLYATRVDSTGTVVSGWSSIAVCTASGDQNQAQIIKDSTGGVLIAWADERGASIDVYALRLESSGGRAPGWPANGLQITSAAGNETAPVLVSDGANGAMIAWQDTRNDDGDIYFTAVNSSGTLDPDFPSNGLGLAVQPGIQASPAIAAAESQAAIVAWSDGRLLPDQDPFPTHSVYAQHVTLAGETTQVPSAPGLPSVALSLECTPNPARNLCRVRLALPAGLSRGNYVIEAYDIQGRRVSTIAKAVMSDGPVVADWNLSGGASIAPGVYHVVARVGGRTAVRRVLVLP